MGFGNRQQFFLGNGEGGIGSGTGIIKKSDVVELAKCSRSS